MLVSRAVGHDMSDRKGETHRSTARESPDDKDKRFVLISISKLVGKLPMKVLIRHVNTPGYLVAENQASHQHHPGTREGPSASNQYRTSQQARQQQQRSSDSAGILLQTQTWDILLLSLLLLLYTYKNFIRYQCS